MCILEARRRTFSARVKKRNERHRRTAAFRLHQCPDDVGVKSPYVSENKRRL
jgi:hypothetical protein